MMYSLRPATIDDIAEILEIYSYYVTNTFATFEIEIPSIDEFTLRICSILKEYPFIVCIDDGRIIGYAYASQHRERAAYRYSVDVSVYVRHEYTGKGAGTAMYTRLFEMLCKTEYHSAYAGITLPNEMSIGLHSKFGFKQVGIYHEVGYKFGKWQDVVWMERLI